MLDYYLPYITGRSEDVLSVRCTSCWAAQLIPIAVSSSGVSLLPVPFPYTIRKTIELAYMRYLVQLALATCVDHAEDWLLSIC